MFKRRETHLKKGKEGFEIEEDRKINFGHKDLPGSQNSRSKGHRKFSFKTIISLLLIIFLLWLFFSLTRSFWNTVNSQGRVIKEREQIESLKSEVAQLKERKGYLESDDFLEEEGRNKLGLVKEGEKVLVLPEDIIEEIQNQVLSTEIESTGDIPVWRQWYLFFLN